MRQQRGPYPLVLQPAQIRRMLEPHASLLLLPRDPKKGVRDVHDAKVLRQNARLRKFGRVDEQQEPYRITIDVTTTSLHSIAGLKFADCRAAGYRSASPQPDLVAEWQEAHPRTLLDRPVWLCSFKIVEPVRLLAQRGDYTSVPALALKDELPAVGEGWLKRFAKDAAEKRPTSLYQERYTRSLGIRFKDAARRGDLLELAAVHSELGEMLERLKEAA